MSKNIKEFPLERYKFYIAKNKVIAVSTYAGKTVRGVAVCADSDTFDIEKGKRLAAARCNVKIAEKRLKNAEEESLYFEQLMEYVHDDYYHAESYRLDAEERYVHAVNNLEQLIETM